MDKRRKRRTVPIDFQVELVRRRLTQAEIAKHLNVSKSYLNDIVLGARIGGAVRQQFREKFGFEIPVAS